MSTMNISLPKSLREWVEEQVIAGGYSTSSEYFRDLLRQDQKRKAQERLEALLLEGLESGAGAEMTPQDWEDLKARARARWAQTHRAT